MNKFQLIRVCNSWNLKGALGWPKPQLKKRDEMNHKPTSTSGGVRKSQRATAIAYAQRGKDRLVIAAGILLAFIFIATSYFIFLDFYQENHQILGLGEEYFPISYFM